LLDGYPVRGPIGHVGRSHHPCPGGPSNDHIGHASAGSRDQQGACSRRSRRFSGRPVCVPRARLPRRLWPQPLLLSGYPATDIFTDRGCAFVAPTDGVVDEVSRVDRWDPTRDHGSDRGGLSVSIIGIDGVRYYGSHLQSIGPGISHGARVPAGRLLGRIDNSGDARTTPTHVHFGLSWPTPPGIWWIRRGLVYPWAYLDAWRAGRNLSPAPAIQAAHAAAGSDIPACRIRC
jgi:peptidoglycan LD-endopeptidase LytH